MSKSCTTKQNGSSCPTPSDWSTCQPWDITAQDKLNCYIDNLQQEALNKAGARINVLKLLGVQEQTQLTDLAKNGEAISGGDWQGFPPDNAFTTYMNEWRSHQAGVQAILASCYIGYDFGVVKLPNGRQRYGTDANIRHEITTLRIKQSANPNYRITKARVERSDDGMKWYGVAVITLPNDDKLNTVNIKHSVPNRYWRLRPLDFLGGPTDVWAVQALEMHEHMVTSIDNIQDKIWMENRNRDYDNEWVQVRGFYDITAGELDVSKFMAELGISGDYRIRINFTTCLTYLGRPIIIGDIIELPSEKQYTPTLEERKKYLEVTDVTWDPDTYTPGWMPTTLLIIAKPAIASEETQDVFGDLAGVVDTSGLYDQDNGNNKMYQDYSAIDQTIAASARTAMPEWGSEGSNTVRQFSEAELTSADKVGMGKGIRKMNFNGNGLYVEDAIPQNGAAYSEGTQFPATPADGEYHRLTYSGLAKDVPARLYRWSGTKHRWIYLETDRRQQFNSQSPRLDEYTANYMNDPNKLPAGEIK